MDIRCLSAAQLSADDVAAWDAIQRSDSSFASPYFRSEYTQAVAAVRGDIEVAIMRRAGEAVGFFPFQRRGRTAIPVGGKLSDFQGVVTRETNWEPTDLLRASRISTWRFDHLLATQAPLVTRHWQEADSPYIDLRGGPAAYGDRAIGQFFDRAERKVRYAEKEAGPTSLVLDTDDPRVFRQLIAWKTDQYRRTGMPNVLQHGWTVGLLERIWRQKQASFSGVLTALYLGGILAAGLLSMRSGGVMHAWFSAYRPEFAPLSPGIVLWAKLFSAIGEQGIDRVDLGKGPEEYKRQLMSGAIPVAEGVVGVNPLTVGLRRRCEQAYHWVRKSPLRKPLLVPGRALRRFIEERSLR